MDLLRTLFAGVFMIWLIDFFLRVCLGRDDTTIGHRLLPHAPWLDLYIEPSPTVGEQGAGAASRWTKPAARAGDELPLFGWGVLVAFVALLYLCGVLANGVSNWFYDSPGIRSTPLALWGREDDIRAEVLFESGMITSYESAGALPPGLNSTVDQGPNAVQSTSHPGMGQCTQLAADTFDRIKQAPLWAECKQIASGLYYKARNRVGGLGQNEELRGIQERIDAVRSLAFIAFAGFQLSIAALLAQLLLRSTRPRRWMPPLVGVLGIVLIVVWKLSLSTAAPSAHGSTTILQKLLAILMFCGGWVFVTTSVALIHPTYASTQPNRNRFRWGRMGWVLATFAAAMLAADLTWNTQEREYDKITFGVYGTEILKPFVRSHASAAAWPSEPTVIATAAGPFEPSGLALLGEHAYVVNDDDQHLRLYRFPIAGVSQRTLFVELVHFSEPPEVRKLEALARYEALSGCDACQACTTATCLWVLESASYAPQREGNPLSKDAQIFLVNVASRSVQPFALEPALSKIRTELGVPWLQLEGLTTTTAGNLLVGLRKVGRDFRSYRYVEHVYEITYDNGMFGADVKPVWQNTAPVEELSSSGTWVWGLSALARTPSGELLLLRSHEAGPETRQGVASELCRLKLAPPAAPEQHCGRPFPGKAEGVARLDDARLLFVFDSDSRKSVLPDDARDRFPLRENEDIMLVTFPGQMEKP